MTTWAIGDIHGDSYALERVLEQLVPRLHPRDTLVFLGDYVDRGPDSRGVVQRVRDLVSDGPCKVVALRGNHEDTWARSFQQPNPAFLLHRGNGCAATWRSFTAREPAGPDEEMSDEDVVQLLNVSSWLPPDVAEWMASLPAWYEDEHALYVHAGLDGGEHNQWHHPSEGREKPLFWMREPEFFTGYSGKRVIFGHTRTRDLPTDHLGFFKRLMDDLSDVWRRGDLIGVDTGAGMGGFLSAVSLPDIGIIESR